MVCILIENYAVHLKQIHNRNKNDTTHLMKMELIISCFQMLCLDDKIQMQLATVYIIVLNLLLIYAWF